MTFYLDRFRTNEPVRGAVLEVETPEGQRTATETGEASYVLPAPWLAKAGSHDLLVTVTAGDAVDVMTVPLTIPETKAPAAAPPPTPSGTVLAKVSGALGDLRARLVAKDPVLMLTAAAAFLLGMLITVLTRGRRSLPAVAVMALVVTLALGTAAFAHGDEDHGAPAKGTPVQGAALPRRCPALVRPGPAPARRLGFRAQAHPAPPRPANQR